MQTHTQIAVEIEKQLLSCYKTAARAAKRCDDDKVQFIWRKMHQMAETACSFLASMIDPGSPAAYNDSFIHCNIIANHARRLAEWHS